MGHYADSPFRLTLITTCITRITARMIKSVESTYLAQMQVGTFPMNEKREIQRRRALKAGTIRIDDKSTIDCVVRDLSNEGASLEIENPIGIPDRFTLVTKANREQRACHVIWWSARRIGVRFKQCPAPWRD